MNDDYKNSDDDDKCFLAQYYITKRINEKCHQCHDADNWAWFDRMAINLDPNKLTIDRLVSLYTTVRWAKQNFSCWHLFVDKIYNNWVDRLVDKELIDWIKEDVVI